MSESKEKSIPDSEKVSEDATADGASNGGSQSTADKQDAKTGGPHSAPASSADVSSSSTIAKRSQVERVLVISTIAVVLIMVVRLVLIAYMHPLMIGWDPALHLQAAQLIVRGKLPYVDMMDVNPPLIWYLDMVPAALSDALNFPVTQSFNYFLAFLIAYSALTSAFLLFKCATGKERVFILPFLVGLCLFNFFLRYDYGQREEIFVLLYIPFLVSRWLRWQEAKPAPLWASIMAGFVGGMGMCLKPYFLIPHACIEIYWMIEKRRFLDFKNAEILACMAAGLAYIGHFYVMPAQMRKTYFEFVVPAFMGGYNFWDSSLGGVLSDPAKRNVFYLATAASFLALGLRKRSSLLIPLIIFTFSSITYYIMQFKGWAYHDQPVFAGAMMLIWMVIGYGVYRFGCFLHKKLSIPQTVLIAMLPIIALAIAGWDVYRDANEIAAGKKFDMARIGYKGESPYADIEAPFLKYILEHSKLGDKVVFISNGVTPGYPTLTQMRCIPGSRHLHSVILSVLFYIKTERPNNSSNQILVDHFDTIVNEFGDDILANKPVLVFLQRGPDYFGPLLFEQRFLYGYDKIEDNYMNFGVYKLRK